MSLTGLGRMTYCIHVVLISLAWPLRAWGGEIPLKNLCPSSNGGNVTRFSISECNSLPCTFVRGRLHHIRLDYMPGTDSTIARIKCGSVMLGQPQTVADWNACDELYPGCPIEAFQVNSYRASIRVPSVPPGNYPLYCEFIDDSGLKQICVAGEARIVLW